jgi:hypothetical protein
LKHRVGGKEEWSKPVSVFYDDQEPKEASLNLKTIIARLEEVLDASDPKNPDEINRITAIRTDVHLLLSGQGQVVGISKERRRVRAHYDKHAKS